MIEVWQSRELEIESKHGVRRLGSCRSYLCVGFFEVVFERKKNNPKC